MKTLILKPLLATGVVILFSLSAKGQCRYVNKESENTSKGIELPCSFPIYINTGNAELDKTRFDNEVQIFKQEHPELKEVIFRPDRTPVNPNIFIEISQASFNALSEDKQKQVKSLPDFYHIL